MARCTVLIFNVMKTLLKNSKTVVISSTIYKTLFFRMSYLVKQTIM